MLRKRPAGWLLCKASQLAKLITGQGKDAGCGDDLDSSTADRLEQPVLWSALVSEQGLAPRNRRPHATSLQRSAAGASHSAA